MYPSQEPHLTVPNWEKVLWEKKKQYDAKRFCLSAATFLTVQISYPPAYPTPIPPARTAPVPPIKHPFPSPSMRHSAHIPFSSTTISIRCFLLLVREIPPPPSIHLHPRRALPPSHSHQSGGSGAGPRSQASCSRPRRWPQLRAHARLPRRRLRGRAVQARRAASPSAAVSQGNHAGAITHVRCPSPSRFHCASAHLPAVPVFNPARQVRFA